jgi:hypothetical protein
LTALPIDRTTPQSRQARIGQVHMLRLDDVAGGR